ncbi:MAG: ribonuclease HII [Microbacteriaceae bacterium]|nr:ribonuclease HII [Microbacteriaceae bacterium]
MTGISSCAKDPTLDFEFELLAQAPLIIGVDEVGRGAIAGPVAVGAQVFSAECGEFPAGLRDSKLLTEKRRQALLEPVCAWGVGAVGYASAAEIDAHGVSAMLGAAGRSAFLQLAGQGVPVERAIVLVDGSFDWLSRGLAGAGIVPAQVLTRVGADRACAVVAAASIRAKVARDTLMCAAAEEHPYYSWESNKGYGSKAHYAGIAEYGATDFHRKTWLK